MGDRVLTNYTYNWNSALTNLLFGERKKKMGGPRGPETEAMSRYFEDKKRTPLTISPDSADHPDVRAALRRASQDRKFQAITASVVILQEQSSKQAGYIKNLAKNTVNDREVTEGRLEALRDEYHRVLDNSRASIVLSVLAFTPWVVFGLTGLAKFIIRSVSG